MAFVTWLSVASHAGRLSGPVQQVPQDLPAGAHTIRVQLTGGQNTNPARSVRVGIEVSHDNGAIWAEMVVATFLGGAPPPAKGGNPMVSAGLTLASGDQARGFAEVVPSGSVTYGLDGEVL